MSLDWHPSPPEHCRMLKVLTAHRCLLRQKPNSTFQTLSRRNVLNGEPPEEACLDEWCLFPHTSLLLTYNRHMTVLPVSGSLCGLRSRGLEACLVMDTCVYVSVAAEMGKGPV